MTYYYKEIVDFPFRDYTLEEFSRWRDILKKAKNLTEGNKISVEDYIQIIYYQLAIENYDIAFTILETCNNLPGDNAQVIFLKLLLDILFTNVVSNNEGKRTMSLSGDFENGKLLGLCQDNYRPAILLLGKHEKLSEVSQDNYRPAILLKGNNEKASNVNRTLIDQLVRIEQVVLNNKLDKYYANNITNNISGLKFHLGEISSYDDIHSDSLNMFRFALEGSDVYLLRVVAFCITVDTKKPSKSEDTNADCLMFVEQHAHNFEQRLIEKISTPDYLFILNLLHLFVDIDFEKEFEGNHFDYLGLIDRCLSKVYDYLVNSGNNVEIILGYLGFISTAKAKIQDNYVSICEKILFNCYSAGLLYLPITFGNRCDIQNIYVCWKFNRNHADFVNSCVPVVFDLVGNYLGWNNRYATEQSYKNMDVYGNFSIDLKIRLFDFLIETSPLLWKAAVYVFGIDLINNINLVSAETYHHIDEIVKQNMEKKHQVAQTIGKHFVSQTIENLIIVLNYTVFDLTDHDSYFEAFGENVDKDLLETLKTKGRTLKQNLIRKGNNLCDILLFLFEVVEFNKRYEERLNIHDKYKFDGDQYNTIKNDFDNRAANQIIKN